MFENEIAIDEAIEAHEGEPNNEPPAPLWASMLTAVEPQPEAQQEPDEAEAAGIAANDALAGEGGDGEDVSVFAVAMQTWRWTPDKGYELVDPDQVEAVPGEQIDKTEDAAARPNSAEATEQGEAPSEEEQSKISCAEAAPSAKARGRKRSVRTTFYTTPEVLESLKEEASKRGVPRSQVIEESLSLYFSL